MGRVVSGGGTVPVTEDLIEAARSPRGGWTRAGLALLGVPWPPPKGWRRRLPGRRIPRADAERLLRGSAPAAEPEPPAAPLSRLEQLARANEAMAADGWWGWPLKGGES